MMKYFQPTNRFFLQVNFYLSLDNLLSQGALIDKTGAHINATSPEYIAWKKSDIYEEILADIDALKMILKTAKELDDPNFLQYGWNKGEFSSNKKTWYRSVTGLETLDIACECIVNTHIFNPICLFAEVDLYSNWIPRLSYCHIEKNYSRFRMTVQCELAIPWPFHDRDGVLHGYGATLPDQNAVIVVIRSLDTDNKTIYLDCPLPKKRKEKHVRLTLNHGGMYFKYIDENTSLFRGIFNVNPHMSLIPQWLINYATRKVIFMLLNIIQNTCKNFKGTVFEARVKENSYLYDEIRKRLNMTIKKDPKNEGEGKSDQVKEEIKE